VGLASELRKPHEHELTRLETESVAFPGQDNLDRVLRQSVHTLNAVPVPADQKPPEQRAASEGHEGQDGEQGEVDGKGPRTRLGATNSRSTTRRRLPSTSATANAAVPTRAAMFARLFSALAGVANLSASG